MSSLLDIDNAGEDESDRYIVVSMYLLFLKYKQTPHMIKSTHYWNCGFGYDIVFNSNQVFIFDIDEMFVDWIPDFIRKYEGEL